MLKDNRIDFIICLPRDAEKLIEFCNINGYSYVIGPEAPLFRYYCGGPNHLKVVMYYLKSRNNYKLWEEVIEKYHINGVLLNSIVLWPLLSFFYKNRIPSLLFIRETQRGSRFSLFNQYIRWHINKYASSVSFLSKFDQSSWGFNKSIMQVVIPDVIDIENADRNRELVDLSQYNKNYEADKDVAILFSGGISRLKGTLTAIRVIERLDDRFKLFVCGNFYDTNISLIKN